MLSKLQLKKIIITRRVWQLLAVIGAVLMAILTRSYYPFSFRSGLRLCAYIFILIFSLTYFREERRATKPPDSNLVLNWNLVEAILLLITIVGYITFAFIHNFSESLFYGLFHTGLLGLSSGVAAGEFFWQNTRLKDLDEICRQRYWAIYQDSIFYHHA